MGSPFDEYGHSWESVALEALQSLAGISDTLERIADGIERNADRATAAHVSPFPRPAVCGAEFRATLSKDAQHYYCQRDRGHEGRHAGQGFKEWTGTSSAAADPLPPPTVDWDDVPGVCGAVLYYSGCHCKLCTSGNSVTVNQLEMLSGGVTPAGREIPIRCVRENGHAGYHSDGVRAW